MKAIFLLLTLFATAVNLQASYSEEWIIEGKVSRVYTEEEKAKLIKEHPEISVVGKTNIGLQITVTNCVPVGGHRGTECRKGMTQDIVMSYDTELIKFTPTQHMLLKIRYTYSDSAVPAGYQSKLHQWQLVEVLPEANKKEAQQVAPSNR